MKSSGIKTEAEKGELNIEQCTMNHKGIIMCNL